MIKILFKREDYIGCGNCADISPFYWKMETRDGLAVLIGAKKHGNYYFPDKFPYFGAPIVILSQNY